MRLVYFCCTITVFNMNKASKTIALKEGMSKFAL